MVCTLVCRTRCPRFDFRFIDGITLGASEEVVEVAGGASGMGVYRIGEVSDRASGGQATGVYGAGFTGGPLARKEARVGQGGREKG